MYHDDGAYECKKDCSSSYYNGVVCVAKCTGTNDKWYYNTTNEEFKVCTESCNDLRLLVEESTKEGEAPKCINAEGCKVDGTEIIVYITKDGDKVCHKAAC